MKWVKTAIGAVIAISVIPMIVLSIFNLTRETMRDEVVSFEVDLVSNEVTDNTYQRLYELSIHDKDGIVKNHKKVLYNGLPVTITDNDIVFNNEFNTFYIYFISGMGEIEIEIASTNTMETLSGLTDNDTVEITFEVTTPPVLSGVTATLLSLVSLVFVSGILYSFYKIRMK